MVEALPNTINKVNVGKLLLTWSHINVRCRSKTTCANWLRQTQPSPGRLLLNDISGIARPGQILAIMGSSGVGKTTLLKVLSGQDDPRTTVTTGEISLNGHVLTSSQRSNGSIIGHVEQQELFVETMSSKEHLIFQAMLRMEQSITDVDRRMRVHTMMNLLSLDQTSTTLISQLSGGERKRLTFATVLLTDPSIVLIDEPTSGLDTYLAMRLMNMIRKIAVEQHRIIIVVLHQPTAEMFALVDSLCLVVHGGRQAYFGDKNKASQFFADECHLSASSLDHYIEQLAETPDAGEEALHRGTVVANHFAQSTVGKTLDKDIFILSQQSVDGFNIKEMEEWRSSFGRQLKWLLWRSFISGGRDPIRTVNVFIRSIVPSILFGLIYFNLGQSARISQNLDAISMGILNITINTGIFVILCTMPIDIHLYMKETSRRIYGTLSYYISLVIRDLPLFIMMPWLFTTIVYWLANIDNRFVSYVEYVGIVILSTNTAAAFATFFSSFSNTVEDAISKTVIINLLLLSFSGFFIDLQHIPPIFEIFVYLSHFQYAFSALQEIRDISDVLNQDIRCDNLSNVENGTLRNETFSLNMWCRENAIVYSYTPHHYLGFNVIMLFLLYIVYHTFAFLIIWYRGHRRQLAEHRSMRKQKKKDEI